MAVYSDTDIAKAIADGRLKVEPFDPKTIQPGSIDMSLGNQFRIFKYGKHSIIDTRKKDHSELTEVIEVKDGDHFLLLPGKLLLAATKEKIQLSADLCGRIEGKSSFARLGIMVHITSGFIHPGSYGVQTLEISNMSNLPVKLYPGTKICQIIIQDMKSPAEVPYNKKKNAKYLDQKGPEASKLGN